MDSFFQDTYLRLQSTIKEIEQEKSTLLEKLERTTLEIISQVKVVRNHIQVNPFANTSEEINYFKNVHPKFLSELIYYSLLRKHEIEKLGKCTKKARKSLCKLKIDLIQEYFDLQNDFILYYNSNATHFDEKYFLRNKDAFPFILEECLTLLNDYSIIAYDIIIARYLAYTRLLEYYYADLKRIKKGKNFPNIDPSWEIPADSVWTDSKRNLTELLYALAAVGSVNYGNFDIIKFVVLFEHVFHIDLGNVYHTFSEIKECKNPTQFLDKLIDAIHKKLNEGEK